MEVAVRRSMVSSSATLRFIAVVAIVSLLGRARCCYYRWHSYDNKCYKIFWRTSTAEMADLTCMSENARLATVATEKEYVFLGNLTAYVNERDFWVGLKALNGQYSWSDGRPAQEAPFLPRLDSYNDRYCSMYDGAKVVFKPCWRRFNFICEQTSSERGIPLQPCLVMPGAAIHGINCFWIPRDQEEVILSEAYRICSSAGTHIVQSSEIFHEGVSHFSRAAEENKTYWLNLNYEEMSLYIAAFPDAFKTNGSGMCHVISFSIGSEPHFVIESVQCDSKAKYICLANNTSSDETTTEAVTRFVDLSLGDGIDTLSCPHGYNWKEDFYSGDCFWETSYETSKLSWDDARAYCKSYGGDLASFHNAVEEQIGLSFQYGSASHPYWIGLKYDKASDIPVWSDGSPVDYINWGPNQSSFLQSRKTCVQMDATAKNWVMAYCGELCWFVCRAPKQYNHRKPVAPTSEPMVRCNSQSLGYYFEGYCYESISLRYRWTRAQVYCENHGGNLASVHNEREVDFLIRLLYAHKGLSGNRVWIGLSSFNYGDDLRWADRSYFDFAHWDVNEPNEVNNQERCVSMYMNNAFWNDEKCESMMPFVCKKLNGTTTSPVYTTAAPPAASSGNCPEGWYTFNDRCFLPKGYRDEDKASWDNASSKCQAHGGHLASVRNAEDQAFLAFLLQSFKADAWVGLNDIFQEAQYFWIDNTPLMYTFWAFGEPSTKDDENDCVFLSYNSSVSGKWRDRDCDDRLSYICQKRKDPRIVTQSTPRLSRCIHPQGWLKQDMSCYMLFDNKTTFVEANQTCWTYRARLVSISDPTVEAVVNFLLAGNNDSYWMGLLTDGHKLRWSNDWPMSISRWNYNQPNLATNGEKCFTVSPEGLWNSKACSERLPFICQVTSGRPTIPIPRSGGCPADEWVGDVGDDNCYSFEKAYSGMSWSTANFKCFSKGGQLASIHSMAQLSKIKELFERSEEPTSNFFIGLTRNHKGGFIWSDHSPVDFVNWGQAEPEDRDLRCVYMRSHTYKWHITSCNSEKDFICSIKKGDIDETKSNSEKLIHSSGKGLTGGVIAAITLVVLFTVLAITAAVVVYFGPIETPWSRLTSADRVTSFENALYQPESRSEIENQNTSTLYVHD